MVAQDHDRIAPEIADEPRPLVDVDREPLIVVIVHPPVEQLRVLAERREPFLLAATATPAFEWVWMTQSTSSRAAVDRAVNDEAGLVHGGVGVADQVAVEVDLDQVRRRHLVEEQSEAVEQECPGWPGTRAEMWV